MGFHDIIGRVSWMYSHKYINTKHTDSIYWYSQSVSKVHASRFLLPVHTVPVLPVDYGACTGLIAVQVPSPTVVPVWAQA